MTTMEQADKLAGAKSQAQAQFDSIREMVETLQDADRRRTRDNGHGTSDSEWEAAEQAIHDDALSVEVRSGWITPEQWQRGVNPTKHRDAMTPAEYTILLCTGGPAVRIIGELNEYCEPIEARMECQDWFTPWTVYRPSWKLQTEPVDIVALENDTTAILLAYARCFYFGEG